MKIHIQQPLGFAFQACVQGSYLLKQWQRQYLQATHAEGWFWNLLEMTCFCLGAEHATQARAVREPPPQTGGELPEGPDQFLRGQHQGVQVSPREPGQPQPGVQEVGGEVHQGGGQGRHPQHFIHKVK